ncbi:MAG: hypothetical protein HOI95_29570 [Chromatiales bacterium]|nr:hypothetical protein [Chromatiales bacterium]
MDFEQPGMDDKTRVTGIVRWARWRAIILLVVIAAGLLAFQAGVDVSERPGTANAHFLTQLYYTLGLFVLAGLDLGVPQGGPEWAQSCLWFAYFAAPAITTSAIVETALRIMSPHALRRGLRGHVIIGGCGRLAMLYMRKLREHDKRRPIVVVERHLDNPNLRAAQEIYGARIVHGDLTSATLLDSLRLERAHRVALFTGDDHVNLDSASRIAALAPHLADRTVAHVADLRFLRVIESRKILSRAYKFNSYRTAADHLVETLLVPHFQSTDNRDTVVLAGFGRFGQTVLHELQNAALGQFGKVIIVDMNADSLVNVFAEQIGFDASYVYEHMNEDIHEPRTWHHVDSIANTPREELVFVLGGGVDSLNIRTALWLADKMSGAMVVARCFRSSDFTADISREGQFHIVSTAELLLERFDQEGFFDDI